MGCLYQTDGKIDGMLLDAFDIEGRHMKEVVGSINDDDNNHGFTFEMVQEGAPLSAGWYAATDEATGKEYYYTAEGEVTWQRPQ